ncbi:secretory calcium-binding phosphoprotein 5 [Centroberyx affinis]|uniref:secretory calcium-binding phosphoprotein 5 n=1 Tax=Centroberyx affinis TaxID=166261 RepID=UPI003A5BFC59
MQLAILCLCLASTVSAAPSFFHYLPHYRGLRQPAPPTQVNNAYPGQPQPQTAVPAPISMEIVFPPTFTGGARGGLAPGSFPSHGFIKYSIPQAPGRQSVELYYPYDFTQQKMMPIPPLPQIPNLLPFEYGPQNVPQHMPAFDANPPQSQDPMQPAQQDQPTQTSQVPVNA